jgi:hypothetical protein
MKKAFETFSFFLMVTFGAIIATSCNMAGVTQYTEGEIVLTDDQLSDLTRNAQFYWVPVNNAQVTTYGAIDVEGPRTPDRNYCAIPCYTDGQVRPVVVSLSVAKNLTKSRILVVKKSGIPYGYDAPGLDSDLGFNWSSDGLVGFLKGNPTPIYYMGA